MEKALALRFRRIHCNCWSCRPTTNRPTIRPLRGKRMPWAAVRDSPCRNPGAVRFQPRFPANRHRHAKLLQTAGRMRNAPARGRIGAFCSPTPCPQRRLRKTLSLSTQPVSANLGDDRLPIPTRSCSRKRLFARSFVLLVPFVLKSPRAVPLIRHRLQGHSQSCEGEARHAPATFARVIPSPADLPPHPAAQGRVVYTVPAPVVCDP